MLTSRDESPNDITPDFLRYATCNNPDSYERRGHDSHDESGRPDDVWHKIARDQNGRMKKFKLRSIMVPIDIRKYPRRMSKETVAGASFRQHASIIRNPVLQPASVALNAVDQQHSIIELEPDDDRIFFCLRWA